jgi:arylsulfatase A-like enzyme
LQNGQWILCCCPGTQWTPNLYRNTTAIYSFEGNPEWNLTTAMADEAIQPHDELKEIAPDKPFFVYYVPGGTHSPHHPTPEWITKDQRHASLRRRLEQTARHHLRQPEAAGTSSPAT